MDYKDTLLMPKTDFPMRGNLGINEIDIQKNWTNLDLYNKVLAKNKDNKPFILHDGPPYANGNIHIGHSFQKTLKDFVLRYKTMSGFYTPYIPGWDTHGLPIENEVTKKGINRKEMTLAEFRKVCRSYAIEQVDKQKEQFKRLGILGDWDNPYLTLDKDFEADQINVFAKMVKKGLIYRGLKPIYWSPSSESALAEAEIEYHDKESISIYVAFKITDDKSELNGTNLLIWTTTPWTLPANLAVSVNPNYKYKLIEADKKKYLIVDTLLDKVVKLLNFKDVKVIKEYLGKDLEYIKYKHPFFDRISPVILGEHVTDTDGTGLVHTAPGHGEDDYRVGKLYNLDILCPVDDKGIMTKDAHQFEGMFYEKANLAIVEELEKLDVLLKKETIKHSYPHDWRTRKPVIFRATPQWFASIKMLKNDLLKEVKNVKWTPLWGELRLANMLTDREDWCISRQRAWGVPIPVFYAENGEAILDFEVINHVETLFRKYGTDIWYEKEAEFLLPKGYKNVNSPNNKFKKELDIMDVWFDSGTSYSVLKRRNLPFPADLYLEGSDQYRGWFNSSLITSVAINGVSPYKNIVSHGFTLDGQGRKMSKSLGNTIDPLAIIKQHGADILRLWVATVDYQSDVRISNDLISQVSESYRKIRNTIRFMLGNITDFKKEEYVSYSMRGRLNQVMTIKYKELVKNILDSYETYSFDKVYRYVMPFIINDISAFYLDYTKDILYIVKENDFERRCIQSVLYDITLGLLKLLTPIIPHTTSEAYVFLPFKDFNDIYLENMPENDIIEDEELMNNFSIFNSLRENVLKELEIARENKVIGKSLSAELILTLTTSQIEAINKLMIKDNLYQVLIVSKVEFKEGKKEQIKVLAASGVICERCWNVVESKNDLGLCPRCNKVIGG